MIPKALVNPYITLQLQETATPQQIRERYLMLSKTFHPDKQSTANYQLAKQYFRNIDEAYKSVSTPLRKYVYSSFGMPGIEILEEHLEIFSEFESNIHSRSVQEQVDELIFYYHMQNEADPDEQLTKTQVTGYVGLFGIYQPKKASQDGKYPQLISDKVIFASAAPEIGQFQNTVEIDVQITHQRPTKSIFKLYSQRRFWNGFLSGTIISNEVLFFQSGMSLQTSFTRNITPNTTLTLTPLILQNQHLLPPKITLQRMFSNDVSVSATAGVGMFNFQIQQHKQHSSKILGLDFQSNSMEMTVGYEKEIDYDCQVLCGVTANLAGYKNSVDITLGYHYGVKLAFGGQCTIEVRSVMGGHNFLDFRINKGKNFIRIPFICGVETVAWETTKFSVIVLMYVLQRLLKIKRHKQKSRRKRMLKKSFSHLTDNQTKLRKIIEQTKEQSQISEEFETKTNGLVIIKALYGYKVQINKYLKDYGRQRIDNSLPLANQLQRLKQIDSDKFTTHQQQIYDVTTILQSHVIGSRLKEYNSSTTLPNPCIDQREHPALLIWYYYRGKLSLQKSTSPVNIGLGPKKVNNAISRLLSWLTVNFT